MRLITQRSQVQILSPLPTNDQVRGPFSLTGGRAFGVRVNEMSTGFAPGRGRTRAITGGDAMASRRFGPTVGQRGRRRRGCRGRVRDPAAEAGRAMDRLCGTLAM